MINIDFLLAGCNTRCMHCCVAGGPGKQMDPEDALLCLEKLDAAAAFLPGQVDITLDHEPMNHPAAARILRAAAAARHIRNYHHGMTTGIALMNRKDRDDVLRAYRECGYSRFGITVHGSAAHHDEIVRRQGAYETTAAAARYLKDSGMKLDVSLMVNRFFPGDAESITALLEELQPDSVYCVIPVYVPLGSMDEYETCRANLPEIEALEDHLPRWKQDGEAFLRKARELTVSAAADRLKRGPGLRALFEAPQDELYLSLHPDCLLYVGNSGAETRCLGDLRALDPEKAAAEIRKLPGNRDYGAFYDPANLPDTFDLVQALECLPQDLVYGDFESALYRGLAELGVPTKMDAFRKKRDLYLRQKELLDTFLARGAISRAQYDKSFGDLTVKMGMGLEA